MRTSLTTGFDSSLAAFITTGKEHIIGVLATSVAETGIQSQRSRQIQVWEREIELLKSSFKRLLAEDSSVSNWHVILEYDLPRRQKRPDVIILAHDVILVIEFKFGAYSFDAAARWQVEDYAFNIRDFHAESASRRIVPLLCATEAEDGPATGALPAWGLVSGLQLANREDLPERLLASFRGAHSAEREPIIARRWIDSAYRPTLTIIEAAERLYENHGVREISHSYAANLDKTTDMLADVIERSMQQGTHSICFVTGVPGAGKTLTGLNVVHDPAIRSRQGPSGIFLSGNGPLVRVIREALVMSQRRRGRPRAEAEHEVSTFVQNVHTFLRYYRDRAADRPHENVVVFDEAQRAWDRRQMYRKQGVDASEPAQLLQVMERIPEWAVVIALVGGGQEIFLGEAGLEEWGAAVLGSRRHWSVIASEEALLGGSSVAGHRLFAQGMPPGMGHELNPLAHLGVSVRSHRASLLAEWVNRVLIPDWAGALAKRPDTREYPIMMTRDLESARKWLLDRSGRDPNLRCGLVTTSEDQRLRAHGLETSSSFRSGYRFEKWFLAGPGDVRSSYQLEVAASEFECQGLELDWVGLCWGGDLTLSKGGEWEYRKFRGARWQVCHSADEQAYVRNRYRVLLTRARSGMVIWIPPGSSEDPTRDSTRFDRLHHFLGSAGVQGLQPWAE